MAELRFTMINVKTRRTADPTRLSEGLAAHANPITKAPRFGRRNSDLETIMNDLTV
jgi:hypothetical protein